MGVLYYKVSLSCLSGFINERPKAYAMALPSRTDIAFLSPEQMGKLELLTTFGVVTTLFVSFALHEALYRFVGVEKDQNTRTSLLNQLYSLALFIAGIVALCLLRSEEHTSELQSR